MSKKAERQQSFMETRADWSTRIFANGNYQLLAREPVLYQGFLHQMQTMYNEICRLRKLESMTVEQKSVFEKLCSDYGGSQDLLRNASRFAFEKVFVQVAYRLLGADYFTAIEREARQLWESAGYDNMHIVDLKLARKNARQAGRRRFFRKLNNCKRSAAIKVAEEDFSI